MKKTLFAALLALALPMTATAQITPVPNTGCKGAPATPSKGTARIGQGIGFASNQFPCNSPRTTAYLLFGIGCTQLPALGLSCRAAANPCVLLVPDIIVSRPISTSVSTMVPNDRALVGQTFCVQGGCLTAFATPCLFALNQIVQVKILP